MKALFLELTFESALFTDTYNEIQHFVEKYKSSNLYNLPGDIRLITYHIKTNSVIYLLSNISDLTILEEFVNKYYRDSLNKFGAKGYEDPPSDFKLKPSQIRWELGINNGFVSTGIRSFSGVKDLSAGIKHLLTNIYVQCEAEDSQKANKAMARRLLTAKVYRNSILEKELRYQMQKTFMLVQ